MEKPHLPVDDISEREFNNDFKRKHLDGQVLSSESLKAIEEVFGLIDKSENSHVGNLCCDEAHQHSYACNHYYSPQAGIIDRLLLEIKHYHAICLTINSTVSRVGHSPEEGG